MPINIACDNCGSAIDSNTRYAELYCAGCHSDLKARVEELEEDVANIKEERDDLEGLIAEYEQDINLLEVRLLERN